ncbi:helix-turn-helix domain-containing protein, partial [Domibacillus tundrae]|uniref:helix-turn-helix domain-containing protein n=1 Tax=Domibacillus tundrae TaxID=1587527 RepID=UPI003395A673
YRQHVLHISQKEKAERLNITQSSISKYEKGEAGIDSRMLQKIMSAYQIPKDEFAAAILEQPIYYDTISVHERQQDVFKEEWKFFETLLLDQPILKRELLRLATLQPKEYEKHIKAISDMIKAHMSTL